MFTNYSKGKSPAKKETTSYQFKRFRYHDENGYQLTAAGITIIEEDGIWLIGEKSKSGKILYTDIGGRYEFADGDIYQTISREFNEELYHSCEITRSKIKELYPSSTKLYLRNNRKQPVYVTLVVNIKDLGIKLSPQSFIECRKEVIKHNPTVTDSNYESVELRLFKYHEIDKLIEENKLSSRFLALYAEIRKIIN